MVTKGTSTIPGGKKTFIQQDTEREIDATFSGDETHVGKQFN
jgi:hypothetical protein